MTYHFAIDETGNFSFESESYVCGILVSKNERTIKEAYRKAYRLFFPGQTVPADDKELICDEKFHYTSLSKQLREICKEELLPLADKVFISTGKPLLFANNQNYWQVAVTAVIQQLFTNCQFNKEDKLFIQIDYRADKVWGIPEDKPEFLVYHKILLKQFEKLIQHYKSALDIRIDIDFLSDTKSFFVNLADIVCGISRKNPINPIRCACETVFNGESPTLLLNKNPIAALFSIFQEVVNANFGNIELVKSIFKKTRNQEEQYQQVWSLFYNYLKFQIKQHYTSSNFLKINELVTVFLQEFIDNHSKLEANQSLDVVNIFTEYFSHKGDGKTPFNTEFVPLLFKNSTETRSTRKWEKWVSYHLRLAQIQFNSYNFSLAQAILNELWSKQEKIIDAIGFENKKDEPTVAIIGSLAQSFAFTGELKKAMEYFELSLDYTLKTSSQTYSYLFSCAFLKKDISKAKEYFEKQTEQKVENFNPKDSDVWGVLSYYKLRALDLLLNKQTQWLDIKINEEREMVYPYPLIFKWKAVALYLEDKEKNKEIIKSSLLKGIEALLRKENGFTLNTLALSLIQVLGFIDNTNPYHAKYNTLVAELSKESESFKNYIEKTPFQQIKNNELIWERASFLPFNYS